MFSLSHALHAPHIAHSTAENYMDFTRIEIQCIRLERPIEIIHIILFVLYKRHLLWCRMRTHRWWYLCVQMRLGNCFYCCYLPWTLQLLYIGVCGSQSLLTQTIGIKTVFFSLFFFVVYMHHGDVASSLKYEHAQAYLTSSII